MGRNKVVQVPCDAELYDKIAAYRDKKGLSKDAAAARELILLALRILEHSEDKEELSTRELMEVILEYTVKGFYQGGLTFYQTFDESRLSGDMKLQKEHRSVNQDKALLKIADILAGKERD